MEFFLEEPIKILDTIDDYWFKYRSLADVKRVFDISEWIFIQDEIQLGREGYLSNNSKEINRTLYINYTTQGNTWYSGLTDKTIDISDFTFNITNSYIKPVVINYWNNGQGQDVDSLLYIEGALECELYSDATDEIINIEESKFKIVIYTRYYYEEW